MKEPIFTGSGTAIVTPFSKDDILKVDYDKLDELIEFQIAGGTQAIIINGTTGENPTQTVDEHADVVRHAIKTINGRCKTIAGVGSNDTMTSLYFAEIAKECGADGILMVTPYYNKATPSGLIKHFSYVADRVNIPMILYNVPGRTSVSISIDVYKELAKHPNINGTKEASADFGIVGNVLSQCAGELNLWSGDDACTVPMMSIGAVGVISVASNIIPDVVAKLCNVCLAGDFKTAAEMHRKYMRLFETLFVEVNPMPVKTAMNLMGMDVGGFRLPLCEMQPASIEKLKAAMSAVGLKTNG